VLAEHDIWGSNASVPDAVRAERTRAWAELAFWFQPVSAASGQRAVEMGVHENVDVSVAGGNDGFWSYTSHRYLTDRPMTAADEIYRHLKRLLEQ